MELMTTLGLFIRYGLVGIINTLVHWSVFFLLYYFGNCSQAISNTVAFIVAVTFSYFLNAVFTFKSQTNLVKYLLFAGFMGSISFFTGYLGDQIELEPVLTLILFTIVSFVLGFLWSKFIVFKK